MKCRLLLFSAAVALLIGGCSRPKPLYYYGDYSERYYAYKKNPSEATALALRQAIETAVGNAGESAGGRVPPGMYAELGYLYLKAGNSEAAVASFKREKTLYPESTRFMNRIIAKVEKAEGKEAK